MIHDEDMMSKDGKLKKIKNTEDIVFINKLFNHYEKFGRHELIWRKKISAYRILVSEVMLQQTQVSRVLPKFNSWMAIYPNLRSLKKATLKDVLTLWKGLGYQRRAKALYGIAQQTAILPKSYEELIALPGVGPYTASAVMAFAYDAWSRPVLETNIRTALIEEFHQGETSIHDGILYDDLSRLERMPLVKKKGAREFYYALMDYGAYLKSNKISHNKRSKHNVTQTPYEGSFRQLRAQILFSITEGKPLPKDERVKEVLHHLMKEGFIIKKESNYIIS